MSGIIEESTIDGCMTGLSVAGATLQCTNVRITNPQKAGVLVELGGGPLTLINCDIKPEQIKLDPLPATPPAPRVTTMQYLVVGVKDATPGMTVEVATAKPPKPLPADAMDMNIRNTPASWIGPRAGPPRCPRRLNAL